MRTLISLTAVLAMIAMSPAAARGGHGHSGHGHGMHAHSMHGHSARALSTPNDPTVPPSLTPDTRLTGSAPVPSRRHAEKTNTSVSEKRDPEDTKIDKRIRSICSGC
jgi:hypothetical protein